MVYISVVACFFDFLAGLGNQGKSSEAGVELVWRVVSNSLTLMRSPSFFFRSWQVVIRAVTRNPN